MARLSSAGGETRNNKHARRTEYDIIQSKPNPKANPKHSHIGSPSLAPHLACTPVPVVLDVDVDGVLEVPAELFRLLLKQRIPRDH